MLSQPMFRLGAILGLLTVPSFVSADSSNILTGDISSSASSKFLVHRTSEAPSSIKQTSSMPIAPTIDPKASISITSQSDMVKPKTTACTSRPTILALASDTLSNSSILNVTIPKGQLPITPEITPGWVVAGLFLLLTGVAYTLIGVKSQWVHTFLSTVYLCALGLTVLIVYIMNAPISNELQGGYVAAIIVSSSIVAGASLLFKELTESLGCAVGGFSLGMWLLTLKTGGLLVSSAGKVSFISVFTLAAFAFYLSHLTRDWTLMIAIAFGGATITVLGVDCFSRAGLKEFWAYIWDLNDDLFPLGATTYPITKGLRVETAAIVILAIIGIISQIKLWRIVRGKREQRALKRADAQRDREHEEANVGRDIEENNARERYHWEKAYQGDVVSGEDGSFISSSDIVSERKILSSSAESANSGSEARVMEMRGMLAELRAPSPLFAGKRGNQDSIIFHLTTDDIAAGDLHTTEPRKGNELTSVGSQVQTSNFASEKKMVCRNLSLDLPPQKSPFPIQDQTAAEELQPGSERSSVATFADDVNIEPPAPCHRSSLAKRLSRGTASLLREMPLRNKRRSYVVYTQRSASVEDLVGSELDIGDDNHSSAATVDYASVGDSDNDDEDRLSENALPASTVYEIQLGTQQPDRGPSLSDTVSISPSDNKGVQQNHEDSSEVASNLSDHEQTADHVTVCDVKQSTFVGSSKCDLSTSSSKNDFIKERLPRSFSRVALSYRTNEWAKHLDDAEVPETDTLNHLAGSNASENIESVEFAVPVKVKELQQRAGDGVPEAVVVKTPDSRKEQNSAYTRQHRAKLRVHGQSLLRPSRHAGVEGEVRSPGLTAVPGGPLTERLSWSSSKAGKRASTGFESTIEKRPVSVIQAAEATVSPLPVASLFGSSTSAPRLNSSCASPAPGLVPYSSRQTLLGQREAQLRKRSSDILLARFPDAGPSPTRAHSDAGSVKDYTMYMLPFDGDPDNIPLSQRKSLIQQRSRASLMSPMQSLPQRPATASKLLTTFDPHHSQWGLTDPILAKCNSQSDGFRRSITNDLRYGNILTANSVQEAHFAPVNQLKYLDHETEALRIVEFQRNHNFNQKDIESQSKELQRQQKEWRDRILDEQMRNGNFLNAHKDMMRKLQSNVKEAT